MYAFSFDEISYFGKYETVDEAMADAKQSLEGGDKVWIGEVVCKSASDFIPIEVILEKITDEAFEQCGEAAECWLKHIDKKALKQLIATWLDERHPVPFYEVINTNHYRCF